jgi:hypothetical protein
VAVQTFVAKLYHYKIVSIKKFGWVSFLSTISLLGNAGTASAAQIYSPTSAVITSGATFPATFVNPASDINSSRNKSGLSSTFTSGVTDFDVYLATNPTHTVFPFSNSWFNNPLSATPAVTYDLGSILKVDRLALWNQSNITSFNLLSSTDNITFSTLASGLAPSNPTLITYPADVFSFASTNARYVRLASINCPLNTCGIGEVAFSANTTAVPEPSGMVGTSLVAAAFIGRRILKNRNQKAIASKLID